MVFIINEADEQLSLKLLKFTSYWQVLKYMCFMSWFFTHGEVIAILLKNYQEPTWTKTN